MTDKGVEAFVDAILTDRAPKQFSAEPDDLDVLRVAIEQRATRAEFAGPDPQFVEDLHRRLAAAVHDGTGLLPLPAGGPRRSRSRRMTDLSSFRTRPARLVRRPFAASGVAAAAALIVAGTISLTNLVGGPSPAPVAQGAANAPAVRSGVLLSADRRPVGRTYAYSGNPSWVFMDVQGTAPTGVYTCDLHLVNGMTVPAGVVVVYNGRGDWAHTVGFPVSQLRDATLVSPSGTTVATATFS